MGLNKRAIFEALNKTPLCDGKLIRRAGMAGYEYCAMGALARDVGATNEYLENADGGGHDIWRDFGPAITAKFGIESYEQFRSLMSVNDAERFITRRNKAVMSHVEALSPDEVNEIIREDEPSLEELETADRILREVEHQQPDE